MSQDKGKQPNNQPPHEGGPAPGNEPPLGSPADLGASTTFRPGPSAAAGPGAPATPPAAPVSSDTNTAPSPGTAPQVNPAQPAIATPPAQANAQTAVTAPAPPVVGDQTTSPPSTTAAGVPSPATEAANQAAGAVPATGSTGGTTGQSAGVAAADAAVADRMRPAPEAAPPAPEAPSTGTGVAARAAALIRDQIDILTLRVVYDAQELVRVGAEGPDPVTVRAILETFAAALEHGDQQTFAYTYSRAARPNVPQINDQVLPFRIGLQIGGMFEGIMRDAFNENFADDPALRAASVQLLEQMAGPAKRALLGEPRELVQWQAPRI